MNPPNHACGCCEVPEPAPLALEHRWSRCRYAPCGERDFSEGSDDYNFYTVITTEGTGSSSTWTYFRDEEWNCQYEQTGCSGTYVSTDTTTTIYADNMGDCVSASGTEIYTSTDTRVWDAEENTCVTTTEYTGTSSLNLVRTGYTFTCARTLDPLTGLWSGESTSCFGDPLAYNASGSFNYCFGVSTVNSVTADPAGPETTVTKTVPEERGCDFPAFGPWPGEDADPEAEALRSNQSIGAGSGASYAYAEEIGGSKLPEFRQLEIRVLHEPIPTCYLKVWFRLTKITEDGLPYTVEIDDAITEPYEWTGTGNPCFDVPELPVTASENLVKGTAVAVMAPEMGPLGERVTATLSILKWSYLPGYEPDISDDENPQPNGFPDPEWEPAAP